MSKNFNKGMQQRIGVIQVLIVISIFIMGAKSFDIQIFKARELTQKAENDYSRHITIKGERGQILDRNMNKLATSIDAISVTACPLKIKNPISTARKLSKILKIAGCFCRRSNPGSVSKSKISKIIIQGFIPKCFCNFYSAYIT